MTTELTRHNAFPFSPLTDDSLVGAMIHSAAFGGVEGYVLACELATALKRRRVGDPWAWPNDAYVRYVEVGHATAQEPTC